MNFFLDLIGVETLPSKPTNIEEENILVNTGECCICFCLRLEAKLPEIICPNKSCEVSFHTMCLYQVNKHSVCMYSLKIYFDNFSGLSRSTVEEALMKL